MTPLPLSQRMTPPHHERCEANAGQGPLQRFNVELPVLCAAYLNRILLPSPRYSGERGGGEGPSGGVLLLIFTAYVRRKPCWQG
jgi:hypothetical protein